MSNVYVVVRVTDSEGWPELEPLAAYSDFDKANQQAKVLKMLFDVEIHELELDSDYMVPQDTVTVANG